MFIVLYNLATFVKEADKVVVLIQVQLQLLGLSYLGLDQPETAQKLLEDVTFCPFIIALEKIIVFVGCLGKITTSNTNTMEYKFGVKLVYFR